MTGTKEYYVSRTIHDAQRENAGLIPMSEEHWGYFYDSGLPAIKQIRHVARALIEQFDINCEAEGDR